MEIVYFMSMLLLQRAVVFLTVLAAFASGQMQTRLPPHEVESLKAVARELGKTDWDFSKDPCSGSAPWVSLSLERDKKKTDKAVYCDCSFANSTVCHITGIILKSQNLTGSVPREITRLAFLQELDLTRNFLNGTIPPEWGSMKLVNVSLLGNRITGSIPKELGNISTLANLTLEYNQLSGTIPPELGNLSSIEKLVLMSNNLSGEIPKELAKLATLKDFRIADNNFTGQIPSFIGNLANLKQLWIQASGLTGPIPLSIASLTNMTDLRISDLSGNESTFPPLSNMTHLITLVEELPSYIGQMTTLNVLDLSFNNLTGSVPSSFLGLKNADFIYLTGNSLSGSVPPWMVTEGGQIDLSYNNFTAVSSDLTCQPRKLNLFASSKGNTKGIASCLGNITCRRKGYSLHINCGGKEVQDAEGKTYKADEDTGESSHFFRSSDSNWGYSSTGHFTGDDHKVDSFTLSSNSTIFGQNSQLYSDARLSPLSLTYYAYCLGRGDYTVTLHFAEIMFTNDSTYSSLGRRVFDVYIQLVLKDFNIANEAGGVNKGINRSFPTVVADHDYTLDIRFFWAGKGTNGIPHKGVYGPLISAISVDSKFTPPTEGISAGARAGIVVAVVSIVIITLAILWWKGCLGRKDTMHDLKGLARHTVLFSLRQIKAATNDFDPANKIGEGGFGLVYKGNLSDGTMIAVKQLSSKSRQGNREFVNEIGMISVIQHPHLVKLYGCCIEGNQLLLVYEYMENNNLARALFGPVEHQLHLDWPTRHKICIGIARGLAYLHEESRLKIVHRDIKGTNVLLDKDLVPKISDFGIAKLDDEDNTHMSTRAIGTYGYMAPEYALRGHLTDKADVFSYGVVVLEIVSGRSNTGLKPKEASFHLLDWANSLKENGSLMELVDPRLESNYNKEEVTMVMNLTLLCTKPVATERPSMSTVVSILEGKDSGFGYDLHSGVSNDKMNPQDVSKVYSEEQDVAMHVTWTHSTTTSSVDLYPITVNTDYWLKRDP